MTDPVVEETRAELKRVRAKSQAARRAKSEAGRENGDEPPPANSLDDYGLNGMAPEISLTEPARNNQAKRFKPEMLDDIQFVDDPVHLVEGILPMGPAFGVTFGPPKSLKSFLLMHLGLHIAADMAYCGRAVQAGAVIYITSEGIGGVRRRLIALRRSLDLEGRGVPFALIPVMPNLGNGSEDCAILEAAIRQRLETLGVPLRLIVIDTLRRATPGKSENKTEDMSIFIDNCERLSRAFSCLAMAVHHTPRSDDHRSSGSNSVDGAADIMIGVVRQEGGPATATVARFKDGEEGDQWSFVLRPVEIGTDRNSNPVTSCAVDITAEPARKPARAATAKLSQQQRRVYDILLQAVAEAGACMPAQPGIPPSVRVISRDTLKAYLRKAGWGDAGSDKSDRERLRSRLNEMAGKHAIGLTENHVWPVL